MDPNGLSPLHVPHHNPPIACTRAQERQGERRFRAERLSASQEGKTNKTLLRTSPEQAPDANPDDNIKPAVQVILPYSTRGTLDVFDLQFTAPYPANLDDTPPYSRVVCRYPPPEVSTRSVTLPWFNSYYFGSSTDCCLDPSKSDRGTIILCLRVPHTPTRFLI